MPIINEIDSLAQTGNRYAILEQLQSVTDLPTLPPVFLNIMRLMRDPDTPIKEVARVVESDPAIAMKLLRLINSSFYGLARTVDSVHQAIVLLGANALKNVVISVSIFKTMNSQDKSSAIFNREAFWLHSIGCGLAARCLGKRLGFERDEEGFIAGIIHDIGKVVLDKYFHDELAAVVDQVRQKKISFYQAEQEVLGISHAEIGAFLAENWKLPEKLVEVIDRHHNFNPESESAHLAALIQVSDMVTRRYRIGSGGDDLIPDVDPLVWGHLNLALDDLETWDEELRVELDKSKEMQYLIFS